MKVTRTPPKQRKSHLQNERGMAMIEAVPLLIIFVILTSYGMGLWGAVHTAILQSMGARTYAFATFRNRTNLNIHRDDAYQAIREYTAHGVRLHAINDRPNQEPIMMAAQRRIALGMDIERSTASANDHNNRIFEIGQRNEEGGVEASPIWIMVGYGMCLNVNCGDQ